MSTITIHPKVKHNNTIIMLHGMYCDANSMKKQYNILVNKLIYTKFIFVDSPTMTINWPDGKERNVKSWYNYYTRNDGVMEHDTIELSDMNTQTKRLLRIIENEVKILKDNKKVYLCGSSQGGTVCLNTLMHYHQSLGGLFCMRTILMNNITKVNPIAKNTPIYIFSGENDEIYLLKLQKLSYIHLEYNGYKINWVIESGLTHSEYTDKEELFIINYMNLHLK